LSTHRRLGLPSGLFPSGFPTNILYAFLVSPIRATYPAYLIDSGVMDEINEEVLTMKVIVVSRILSAVNRIALLASSNNILKSLFFNRS
jgi:hypothetical protein